MSSSTRPNENRILVVFKGESGYEVREREFGANEYCDFRRWYFGSLMEAQKFIADYFGGRASKPCATCGRKAGVA